MAQIGVLEGVIRLRDQFTGTLTRATSQLNATGQKFQTVGKSMTRAGSTMTKAITLPIAAVGGAAVAAFGSFDDAMTQSLAIMGDVSDGMRNEMVEAARTVGRETQFSAKQAAESFFFLASAGLDAQQSIAALPQVASFAQAGQFDMAQATDLLTDAQSALGLTVDDTAQNLQNMAQVSDVLVKANTLANASVQQFSTALTSKAGAALKGFNIDIEEGVAVLAAFADQGIKAELAGNALDRVLRLLPDRAKKNEQAFKDMGIEVFDAEGNLNNMADIVADLEGALLGASDETQVMKFQTLGLNARILGMIKPLLGTSDAIREYEAGLRDAGGITQEVAEKQMDTMFKQLGLVKDQFVDVAIELGASLEPAVRALVPRLRAFADFLRGLVDRFDALSPATKGWAITIAAVAAAAGPVLATLGFMVTNIGSLIAAIGGGAAGGGLLGALGSVVSFLSGPAGIAVAVGAVLATWEPFRKGVVAVGRVLFQIARGAIALVVAGFRKLMDLLAPGIENLKILGAVIRDVVGKHLVAMAEKLNFVADGIDAMINGSREAEASKKNWERLASSTQPLVDTLRQVGAEALPTAIQRLNDAGVSTNELKAGLGRLDAQGKLTSEEFNLLRDALNGVGQEATETAGETDEVGEALGNAGEKATELQQAMQALGLTTKKDATAGLEALTKVVEDAAAPADTLVEKWEEVFDTFSSLKDGVTPEVRSELNDLSMEIAAQGGELSAAQIALLSYGDAQRIVAQQVKRSEAEHAKLQARLDAIIQGSISNLVNNAPKVEIVPEFVFGPPEGGPPGEGGFFGSIGDFFGDVGSIFTADEGGLFDPGNIAGTLGGILSGDVMGTLEGVVSQIGGQIGQSLAGPIGAAIGQMAGKLVGVLKDLFGSDAEDFAKKLQTEYSALGPISDDLAQKYGDLADQFKDVGKGEPAVRAMAHVFGDVLAETGIESADAFAFATEQLQGFFDHAKQGSITAADLRKAIEGGIGPILNNLNQMDAKGQVVFRNVIQRARESGEEIQQLTDHIVGAAEGVISGVGGMLSAGVDTAAQARLAGAGLVAAFQEMQAEGVPATAILDKIGSSAKDLRARFKELGEEPTKGLGQIVQLSNVLAKEGMPKLIDSAKAAGEVFGGLTDLGLASQDTFTDFASTVQNSFDQLVAGGASSKQAIALLGPQLQQMQDAAQQFGFQVDAGTAKLLDQARAQGVVKGATLDAAQATQAGFQGLFQRFDAFLNKMGVATGEMFNFGSSAQQVMQGVQGDVAQTSTTMANEFQKAANSASTSTQTLTVEQKRQLDRMAANAKLSLDQTKAKFLDLRKGAVSELQVIGSEGSGAFRFISDAAKKSVDDALGEFQMMQNQLVGGSIVPDTVDQIEREWSRAGDAAEFAAARTSGAFDKAGKRVRGMADEVRHLRELLAQGVKLGPQDMQFLHQAELQGFQTKPGRFKRVPGPASAGRLAIVHGDEIVGRLPAGMGGGGAGADDGSTTTTGRTKAGQGQPLKLQLVDGAGRILADLLVPEIPEALERAGVRVGS